MVGIGILQGLKETARNFIGSYTSEERLVTVQYPEEILPPHEAARYFPFLVYDGDDAEKGLRCVACKICEKECPPQCIYIVVDRDARGKPQKHPKVFDIDLSVCMSCQICVEVCPFDAIKMDTQFELSTANRFGGLLTSKKELAKPNSYYHQIHPSEATQVDARLADEQAKAAAAKAKAAATPKPPAAKPTPVQPSVPPCKVSEPASIS